MSEWTGGCPDCISEGLESTIHEGTIERRGRWYSCSHRHQWFSVTPVHETRACCACGFKTYEAAMCCPECHHFFGSVFEARDFAVGLDKLRKQMQGNWLQRLWRKLWKTPAR